MKKEYLDSVCKKTIKSFNRKNGTGFYLHNIFESRDDKLGYYPKKLFFRVYKAIPFNRFKEKTALAA
jgi:hypothetical protein